MNKKTKIIEILSKLKDGKPSIGGWMQIPSPEIAEIYGECGYDWVAIDMEHGSIDISNLPNLFRALELGNTLPVVRLRDKSVIGLRQVFEAGAAGIIIPNIEDDIEIKTIYQNSCWPPTGIRGVGFSRSNLYGKNFEGHKELAQRPLIVAMIESLNGVRNLGKIIKTGLVDALFIGPYDLSASLGVTGNFDSSEFKSCLEKIFIESKRYDMPIGIHVINPEERELKNALVKGYQFIAFSLDSTFLNVKLQNPLSK